MTRKMHLVAFMINSPMNHTVLSWAHPKATQGSEFAGPKFWQEVAKTLEEGKFDGLFFADSFGPPSVYKNSLDPTIQYGVFFPQHDPIVLIPMMAACTKRLGFAATASTNAYQPYVLSRMFSTLDHLTAGRIGWNIVTAHQRSEYENLGLGTIIPHDERYDRADEYMEVCHKLWNSWEPGALVVDKERGIYADPSKVKKINHEGKYFSCAGPLAVLPSPQGRPVLFQAGSSGRGRDFSAQHADVCFAIQITPQAMKSFVDDMRDRVKKFGRKPKDFKVLFGIQVIVGDTEEDAQQKYQDLLNRIPIDGALARISGTLGFDFSKVNVDQPFEDIQTEASQGMASMFTKMYGQRITIREAATRFGMSIGMPQVIGTAKQVADQLEYLMEYSGADGFNITPTYESGSWTEFVEQVVPELQRRGVYRREYSGATFKENLADD